MTTALLQTAESSLARFFQHSAGHWRSERRYYTLPEGPTQEIESSIEIAFLAAGSSELEQLARMHDLSAERSLVCGARVSWQSNAKVSGREQSQGATVFGALGDLLYRDRGFAIHTPVIARYSFSNLDVLCLRTEYGGSVFEEEIRLVGERYRTRQTIISRAGEQKMIGQYLETRLG